LTEVHKLSSLILRYFAPVSYTEEREKNPFTNADNVKCYKMTLLRSHNNGKIIALHSTDSREEKG
jgi:hypothetical protein